MTMSYAAFGSGERHACGQLRCLASAPRSSARPEYLTPGSGLVAIVRLDLANHLVGAEEGVLGHVLAVAARRWTAAETLGERADVMRTGATADTEIANVGRESLAAEIEDLRARGHEGVQAVGERHPVTATGIPERHERRLRRGGAIRDRESGDMAFDGGTDLLEQRQHGARAAMAIETHDIGAGRFEPLAGLRRREPLARKLFAVHGEGDYRGHLRVAANRLQRNQRLACPAESLGHEVVDSGLDRPADLLIENPLDLLHGLAVGRVIDVRIAQVPGEQRAGAPRDALGDAERGAIHRHEILLSPDDTQLLAVHVIGERLSDIRACVDEVHVELLYYLRVLEQHLRDEGP